MSEPTFEEAQAELERIVERLERGEVGARGARPQLWERGEELYRRLRARSSTRAQGKDRGARAKARRRRSPNRQNSGMATTRISTDHPDLAPVLGPLDDAQRARIFELLEAGRRAL